MNTGARPASQPVPRSAAEVRAYNRKIWDRNVEERNEWTLPVSPAEVAAARHGQWQVRLTATRPVPRPWFPPHLAGLDVLCLASGGGQQGPILSAAGANVTVYDNSPLQLRQDQRVAERDGLDLRTVEGDMADLSAFAAASFDLIFHPVSNLFAPDVRQVWREAYRVLRPGGRLLSGFLNPVFYLFDRDLLDDKGEVQVRYRLPYSDLTSLTPQALQKILDEGWPLEFSHTLEEQIGGQTEAGFYLTGLYEDVDERSVLQDVMPVYIATLSFKP